MKKNINSSLHISEVEYLLDKAKKDGMQVNVEALDITGALNAYNGWYVQGGYWRGGFHRLRNPVNGEIRAICDVLIIKFNNCNMYL